MTFCYVLSIIFTFVEPKFLNFLVRVLNIFFKVDKISVIMYNLFFLVSIISFVDKSEYYYEHLSSM